MANKKIKRMFYFKEFPDKDSIEKMDFVHKLGWLILDKLEYTRVGNAIILDCKKPVKSVDIVSFYKQMYEIGSFEKIVYEIIDDKDNYILEILFEESDNHPKMVVFIIDKINNIKKISYRFTAEKGAYNICGEIFSPTYVIDNGITLLDQLELNGNIVTDIEFLDLTEDNTIPSQDNEIY